jgi:predicted transcriptional regulator YdeE
MRQVYVESFSVYGITIRTTNKDEMDPQQAKIGHLWQNFFTLCSRAEFEPEDAYGVYSAYDSDWNGEYSVTAALKKDLGFQEGKEVVVPSGKYLRFEKTGNMPETALLLWQEVWDYFQEKSALKRNYLCDFEEYTGTSSVAIYIGIVEDI